ncbi:hypothetical protein KKF84_20530, partial [Myxococcota bacterium]|nr:hypothetical protein [Myxococcota bacterium]
WPRNPSTILFTSGVVTCQRNPMVINKLPLLLLLATAATLVMGCNLHGKKIKYDGSELYYKDPITKTKAK